MAISIGDAVLKVGVDTKSLERGMKGIGATIKKHQKAIGIGMMAMGGAILAGAGMALKTAADFETAMREVNTMVGLSQEEFRKFSDEALALATSLGIDAVEGAKALYQAISAGVPKENVLEFLEIAAKAAIGGVTDTITAVDGLTTVLNAFKIPMSEAQMVADIMFTTVKGGKTTFEELSASMFNVAPIAAAAGVKFNIVAAALATMTKQGVPTSVATTQLRQAIVALMKPTADMGKVIEDLGYASGQAMLEEEGFAETLRILRNATEGNNEMLMKMFGSIEAGAAVLSLTGDNFAMFTSDIEAMINAEGAATAAFEEMELSASRQMAKLKASFKGITIEIGNVLMPILTELLETVKPVIENIMKWTKENPKLTKMIIIGTAALGALLVVFGGLILALPLLGTMFTLALGPIGLIIAAIAGLIAVGIFLWKNWDQVVTMMVGIWNNLLRAAQTAFSFMKNLVQTYLIDPIMRVIELWQQILGIIRGLGGGGAGEGGREYVGAKESARRAGIYQELGTGGIAMRPMPALIGERGPEAVIPLDRLSAMLGGTRHIHINLVDGRELAEVVVGPLGEMTLERAEMEGT